MELVKLRRSRIVQSLAYGCLLGLLAAVPSIILGAIDAFPRAASMAEEVALIGGVPAAVTGAVTWFFVVLLRGHTAPTGSGVFACWCGTVIGSYSLVPIWIGVSAAWRRCSFSDRPSLDQCWEHFSGMVAFATMLSGWGFIFTVPVVLPFLLFGAWLWVRRLHPRLAGTHLAQPVLSA